MSIISIGIREGRTTSPLPPHRTFGSRIRRFGRFRMLAPAQALACGSPRQRHTRSGHLPYAPPLPTRYDRAGLPGVPGGPLPSADSAAERRTDSAALCPLPGPATALGTAEASRGQRSYRPGTDAGCIQHRPLWLEACTVACPRVPTVPPRVSGACPSPRTFVPRCLQTSPHANTLALPLSCGSTYPWTRDVHSRA
jgi:hypothetical protein